MITSQQILSLRCQLSLAAMILLSIVGSSAVAGSWVNGSYTNAYGARTYKVWVPSGYVPGQQVPLVVAVHGCNHSPDEWAGLTRINTLADSQKFMVLYPAQSAAANPSRCWNYFLPANQSRDAGEPSIIMGMVSAVRATYSVNAAKIYVFGISAGGAMTSILASCYPDVFAAAGISGGLMYKATTDGAQSMANGSLYDPRERGYDGWACGVFPIGKTLPMIVFQGSVDPYVTPINSEQIVTQVTQWNDFADDSQNNATVMNVVTDTVTGSGGGRAYTLKRYNYGGIDVAQYYSIIGLAHTWSGGDPAFSIDPDTAGPDATTIMWNYLKLFSRY